MRDVIVIWYNIGCHLTNSETEEKMEIFKKQYFGFGVLIVLILSILVGVLEYKGVSSIGFFIQALNLVVSLLFFVVIWFVNSISLSLYYLGIKIYDENVEPHVTFPAVLVHALGLVIFPVMSGLWTVVAVLVSDICPQGFMLCNWAYLSWPHELWNWDIFTIHMLFGGITWFVAMFVYRVPRISRY
jgi:hypothetical protein